MRVFITHIAPKDRILEYGLSVAACNFSRNLTSGGMFDRVYSVLPAFIHGYIKPFDGLVCSVLRRNRMLCRLAPIAENVSLFGMIPRNTSVWYYNCTTLNALLILLLKWFKPSVRQYLIILDYTPSTDLKSRFLLWLINRMTGTIKLANSPLFTMKNSICLPGVVPHGAAEYPKVEKVSPKFLISGVLSENIAMLSMLLEAFSTQPELRLHITGKAPDEELIARYIKRCPNIVYHGMVAYEEYLRILNKCPFQLSTRNPQMPENRCNFPSKIMEALLHNRIIISTIHYPQLEGIRYFEVGADVKTFTCDIRQIVAMGESELRTYANQSEEVKRRFSTEVWNETICKIEQSQANKEIAR